MLVSIRWFLTDHTGSLPELTQNVLPPLSPSERGCDFLAGPSQGKQRWALQRDTCGERQSPSQALPSLRASAAVQSLHHTGRSMGEYWAFVTMHDSG